MSNPVLTDELQEELDNLMQKGYAESMKNNSIAASEIWIKLWERIKEIMKTYEIPNIEAMDKAFHGRQNIFNWSTDVEAELYNASNKEKRYLQERIAFCREYIAMSKKKDDYNNLGRRRAIAESYVLLGNVEEGERLFKEFVHQYPKDGYGWINWSDQYGLFADKESRQDDEKAVSILEKGLDVPGLEYREDILDRLEGLYRKMNMHQKADDARHEIEKINSERQKESLENIRALKEVLEEFPMTTPAKRQKPGRNDPCPCGSGMKYKKCCGR